MKQDYNLLNTILNCLHDKVALIGKDLQIHYYNQAFESFLLLNLIDTTEIEGRPIEEIFPAEMALIAQTVTDCFTGGQIAQRTIELDHLNRQAFYRVVVIPHHSGEGEEIEACILILYSNTEVELKRLELKHQIQFLSKLIRRLPIGVYMFDMLNRETSITLWNPKMADYFNLREEDVLGRKIDAVFDEETVKSHLKAIDQINSTGLYFNYPAEHIRTPRGMRYFQTILAPMVDREDPHAGDSYLSIMEDVSDKIVQDQELKKYQKELKEALAHTSEKLNVSNAEISSILDNSYGISIFSLDSWMRYRVFNTHHQYLMLSLFDIEIEQGGQLPPELYHLSDRKESFQDLLNKAVQGKNTAKELHYKLPNGSDLYMDGIISPLYSQDEIIGVTVILFDTTERRLVEKEAEIFKSVAENADYGVLLTGMDLSIHYANRYWKELFIFSGKNLIGENLSALLREEQIREIRGMIRRSEGQDSKSQLELDLPLKDNKTITILMNFVPYSEIDGGPGGIAFTCLDITPMKEAREALIAARDNAERSSILKSTFVANMSHEIRTPLNAILGFADLMKDKLEEPQLNNYLENILSSGSILKRLINDILDFSKIEAGKMTFSPRAESIVHFFQELFQLFNLQAVEKKLLFEVVSDEPIPEVLVFDSLRLRQVLINLIGNAMKFTRFGYVRLILHYDWGRQLLTMALEDTGIGIPREEQREIFNPFEQQEKQDSRNFEGTGLGLSITKKLAMDLMGGQIRLKSKKWAGSRFTIILPLKRGESSVSHKVAHQEPLFRERDELSCLVEPSLWSGYLENYGKKNKIAFQPLAEGEAPPQKGKNLILTRGRSGRELKRGEVLIRVLQREEMPDACHEGQEYFLCDGLEPRKMLPMIHSILKMEMNEINTGELDFTCLDEGELEAIGKAMHTKNFQDIGEAAALIKKCGDQGSVYSQALEEALASFDIPKLNKIMAQIQEYYTHKEM